MRAHANGIAIDYEVTGDGPVVLLSHGYGSTRHMWDDQHRAFADRWRVISWDMRGHGQTDSPDDPARYSAALTVAEMGALLQQLGVERAVIGGLSLGGYLSMAVSLVLSLMNRALLLFLSVPALCIEGAGHES